MILGMGTDIVKVSRLQSWEHKPDYLRKIFSEQEIEYCTKPVFKPNCLAARFAAKEAFFKALSQTLVQLNMIQKEFALLFACKHVEVVKSTWDVPKLKINWGAFEKVIEQKLPKLQTFLSLSHEKDMAVAFVIVSSNY